MENNSCANFDAEAETIGEFFCRFEVQMSVQLHRVRQDEIKKAAILLRSLPVSMVTDIQRRIAPVALADAEYEVIKRNLLESYSVKKSVIGSAVQFFSCKQQQGQSVEDFKKKLKFLASQCGFDQQVPLNRILRDVFVSGLNSTPVLSAVMISAENLSFE